METWKECEEKLSARLTKKRTEDWVIAFKDEIKNLESKTDATWSDLVQIESCRHQVDELMKQLAQTKISFTK